MKKIFLFFIAILSLSSLNAQNKQYYTAAWDMGFPVGSMKGFISKASMRGGHFSAHYFLNDNVAIGLNLGFNRYYKTLPRQTFYPNPGSAITASSYNYANSIPMTIGGYYHFLQDSPIRPYAGIGIGANYMHERVIIQDTESSSDQWSFMFTPEVGLFIPFGKNCPVGMNISARYNVYTNSFTYNHEKIKPIQNFNLGVGLTYFVNQ